MPDTVVLPVKSFALGKQRLSGVLEPGARAALGRSMASHVAVTVVAAGRTPLIVTGDPEVASWARGAGYLLVNDPGEGLSAAAGAGVSRSTSHSEPWLVLHSDLPWLAPDDIDALTRPLDDGSPVIAPSADGGTSAIGSQGQFSFRFGPASFRRHLVGLRNPSIVARPGLLLDIDAPGDLRAALTSARGAWLQEALRPHR